MCARCDVSASPMFVHHQCSCISDALPVSLGRHRGTSSSRRPGPFLETSKLPNSARDRRFESISLHRRVRCENDFLTLARFRSECGGKGGGHCPPPIVMPARFVGEFVLGRKMRQGSRQSFFDANNHRLDAAEPCFEAIDAGFAHKRSADQQLHNSSAGIA
jgi:hypothetical protein